MSLYVNGALASTGYHTQKSGINGPLTLGRYKYNGAPNSPFKGGISDVTALPRATDPWSSEARAITLSAPNNGKCLDLAGGTAANGTAVQLWDCDPNLPGQKWSIRPDGTIRVLGGCLDAIGGGTGNGTPLEYWPCPANGPAANQLFIPVGDGSLYNPASGRCVDVTNANTANGTRIQLYNCNTTPAQRWTFTPAA
nr:RICIN domain-containing protein [Kitasatospora sp. SID7827]